MKPTLPCSLEKSDSARLLALRVLGECRGGGRFVQEILHHAFVQSTLSAADRRLATQLAYGVLRRRGTLDALLRPVCNRPLAQVEPVIRDILRLGTFQLALMSHIPPHAALFETVELAPAQGQAKAKGFINGVLRGLSRLLAEGPIPGPGPDALPLEQGHYRRLARSVLPDPSTDRVQYLAAGFALPPWLAARWLERFSWEECLRLGFWFAGPAPLWLRCNPLRIERGQFLEALGHAGIQASAGEHPQSVRLEETALIRDLPGYEQGWFAVQDESAMRVASALAPEPGSRVLDLCAAPGGKTTHLAELMQNRGSIVACDLDEERLGTVKTLCERLGIDKVQTCWLGANEGPPPGPYDAALVDVPCSNTGVLGRRPEVRWRLRPDDFRTLVPLQTRLLLRAVERVRPGGMIVYSTCSIEPEENGEVVRAVLRAFPDLVLEAEQEAVPGRPADGGYWARLKKTYFQGSRREEVSRR